MSEDQARIEFLGDIITTAVEGGTGYWAQVSQYQYVYDGRICVCVGTQVGSEARAVLHPLKDDDTGYERNGHVIDPERIQTGIDRIGKGNLVRDQMRLRIMAAWKDNEGGMLDADDADVIVQVALFGKVVYG